MYDNALMSSPKKGNVLSLYDAFYPHNDYLNAIHYTNENSFCQKHLSNNFSQINFKNF